MYSLTIAYVSSSVLIIAIAIVIDETTTALEEAFYNLSDEQLWSRPLADRHSIGTMVMHCLLPLLLRHY